MIRIQVKKMGCQKMFELNKEVMDGKMQVAKDT